MSTSALTVTSFFTVAVFAGSLLLLIVAAICYIPLLLHIRGNLKEYCCHKVDKRIGAIMKRKKKERLADAARLAKKEAEGDYSHLKNKKGEMVGKPLPQPTLPNLNIDDDEEFNGSKARSTPAPSITTQEYYPTDYPPPMPQYNPYSHHGAAFNPSHTHFGSEHSPVYDDDNDRANLAASAAPMAHQGYAVQHDPFARPAGHPYDDQAGPQADNPYVGHARGY